MKKERSALGNPCLVRSFSLWNRLSHDFDFYFLAKGLLLCFQTNPLATLKLSFDKLKGLL